MLRKLSIVPFLCARSAKSFFTLLYPLLLRKLLPYPFLLRKLFIVPFLCARSAKKTFTVLCPFLLRKLFIVTFLKRAARIISLLDCTLFCLENFLLYLLVRAQREESFYFTVPLLLRKLFFVPFFCARSAKPFFTLLYPVLLGKLFIVPFLARAARRKSFDLYPFFARAARRKFLLSCAPF